MPYVQVLGIYDIVVKVACYSLGHCSLENEITRYQEALGNYLQKAIASLR